MSVFANGMEVSGKATPNKTIAAMPDVCMSPPPPPAGPVPIPYPLTGMASDTTEGCTSVFVKGKEAGKKNSTKYSKTTGNEPATNSFGANVITHKITGPLKFAAYSFDVIFEGGGACRFGDLTTQNHMNTGGGSVGASIAGLDIAQGGGENPCEALSNANDAARADMKKSDKPQYVQESASDKTTISHARYTPPSGPPTFTRACSRQVVTQYDNTFVEGLSSEQKQANKVPDESQKMKSNACGDHTYNRGFFMPHSSHTEARIIEDIFNKAKMPPPHPPGLKMGKLVISVDWPGGPNKGFSTKDPCDDCRALICAASACLEITLCDEENEPQKPKCPK